MVIAMDKDNIYFITAKGSNYKMQSGGRDWMGFHYAAMRKVSEHNNEYNADYEVISVSEYERRFEQ